MAVYFKFKSVKDFDSVSIDANFISVGELKEKIVDKMMMKGVGNLKDEIVRKKRTRKGDVLVISNCETKEDYLDDSIMIPKHTSVLVQRRPLVIPKHISVLVQRRPLVPIVATDKQKSPTDKQKSPLEVATFKSLRKNSPHSFVLDEVDEFGFDVYAPIPFPSQENEDKKIRAFLETSTNQWQKQLQGSPLERHARNGQRLEHGQNVQNTVPHPGYVCHRCGVPDHFIQHCPTNGDPKFDIKKVRPPTGIPKTMLIPDAEGAYFLPTGQAATLKPNEAVFEREVDFLPSVGRQNVDIPPELCCPLCKDVFKDAVLVSKCCFMSYCDKCIRDHIISKTKCVCGARILADDLLPNRTLRDAIRRVMESQGAFSTSRGNASTITSSGSAGPQASAVIVPKQKNPDSKKPVAGGRQGQKPQLSLVLKKSTSKDVETGDSSESQLRESVNDMGEIVSANRPPNQAGKRKVLFTSLPTSDLRDKRLRTGPVSMWRI